MIEDFVSFLVGLIKGRREGEKNVTITGSITCTDDGDGNITITEG